MGQGADAEILVRYRTVGGPVAVDQSLTVHSNGFVVLEERHRNRGPTELRVSLKELDRIRSALDQIPAWRWSSGSGLNSLRFRSHVKALLTPWDDYKFDHRPFFELALADRSIAGEVGDEPAAEAALELLDSLRVHAVRTAEELDPT